MMMTMALMAATIAMAVTTGKQHYANNGDEAPAARNDKEPHASQFNRCHFLSQSQVN